MGWGGAGGCADARHFSFIFEATVCESSEMISASRFICYFIEVQGVCQTFINNKDHAAVKTILLHGTSCHIFKSHRALNNLSLVAFFLLTKLRLILPTESSWNRTVFLLTERLQKFYILLIFSL